MLSCRELVQDHASDYLDGHLPSRARLGLSMHLLLCRHCRRFIRQFKLLRKVLQSHQLPTMDDTRRHALVAKLQQEQARQKKITPPL